MNQSEIFGSAIWLGQKTEKSNDKFFILRGKFDIEKPIENAELYIVGLGNFYCYINGVRVGDDFYMPLATDYEPRKDFPKNEILSGHRILVPKYDISKLLKVGENTIAIHAGGGWYNLKDTYFGEAKAIYRILGKDSHGGIIDIVSDEKDRVGKSFVSDYIFQDEYDYRTFEIHDYTLSDESVFSVDFDDSKWDNAKKMSAPNTEFLFSDCPADKLCEVLPLEKIKVSDGKTVYDAGKNISGYPLIKTNAPFGEIITVAFSEEITPDGELDTNHSYAQSFSFKSNGKIEYAHPMFTWFGFRYFSVTNNAEAVSANFVHTDIKRTSDFNSDNVVLNWLNEAFVTTQLGNTHGGLPSDCPHMEKRGYTGDGQLLCHAVMNMFDARAFYEKWIMDISDCQDIKTGHVQYTAPYTNSGGGPGGWGSAIVEVPYRYYIHYGDSEPMTRLFPQMLKYFDYLEAHSYGKLIISDKPGAWCLGDWCALDNVALPAPFVNNYFYVKSMMKVIEIANLIGENDCIPMLEVRIAERKEAVHNCYFNSWNGNYLGNIQGANAFALDIGLEAKNTYKNMVEYYDRLGRYDTGIFGTDIVTRILFERGDGELAVRLMANKTEHSFYGMMKRNSTTLWEQWPLSYRDRSRNHPMFGAVAAYLYDYLLGIRAKDNSPAYKKLLIAPVITKEISSLRGGRDIPSGRVSVSYVKANGNIEFVITIPEKQEAEFCFAAVTYPLSQGKNKFSFEIL